MGSRSRAAGRGAAWISPAAGRLRPMLLAVDARDANDRRGSDRGFAPIGSTPGGPVGVLFSKLPQLAFIAVRRLRGTALTLNWFSPNLSKRSTGLAVERARAIESGYGQSQPGTIGPYPEFWSAVPSRAQRSPGGPRINPRNLFVQSVGRSRIECRASPCRKLRAQGLYTRRSADAPWGGVQANADLGNTATFSFPKLPSNVQMISDSGHFLSASNQAEVPDPWSAVLLAPALAFLVASRRRKEVHSPAHLWGA